MLYKSLISLYGSSLAGKSAPKDDLIWHFAPSDDLRQFRVYALDALQRGDLHANVSVEELDDRLTEIYLLLGLTDQARQTAAVLGHNYPGSTWYQDSYALLVEGAQPATIDRPGFVTRALNWLF